jgi:hypothetical protein
MITAADNNSTDLFKQAMGSFETALRTGMKLQEDSVHRCVEILRNVGSPLEWERTVPSQVAKAIGAMQENVAQSIRFMNENAEQTVNLMETALKLHRADAPANEEEGYFWTYALNAMRTNADIIQQANTHVMESWAQLAKEVLERIDVMRTEVNRVTELGMQQK